ncbi:MAG: hypothetical protein LBS21_04680 [Clostridiales bacterium]|nr:hypothetical protein [Clostridiales bacterium]
MKNSFKNIFRFLTNRILLLILVFGFFSYLLLARLFDLQIVRGETYLQDRRETEIAELPVISPRGEIFDRYGRPLAVNETTYTLKLNPSAEFDMENLNNNLYDLILLFEQNGEVYIDELPISKDEPYTLNFSGSAAREARWREDMTISEESRTTAQVFQELRNDFGIDPSLPNSEARKIISLRSAIYMKRYNLDVPITLAVNVSEETMAVVEEDAEKYAGIYVEAGYIRSYPAGDNFSHMLGYIGRINSAELEANANNGYTSGDYIGKSGLEQALEANLRGKNGKRTVLTDAATGLVLSVLEDETKPIPGDNYYLTIDSYLQNKAAQILESKLKEILINRLSAKSDRDLPLTPTDVFSAMVRANTISVKKIWQAKNTDYSYKIREYVIQTVPDIDITDSQQAKQASEIIAEGIEKENISSVQVMMTMVEQGIITADEILLSQIKTGAVSALNLLVSKIESGEITPQMANSDPSTGSIVVLEADTGAVVTAATYPTYDNNQMVHNLNEYFPVVNEDATGPFNYRAFTERRAPGSTFKMITAVTGLEEGSISPSTRIYDEVEFTKAGEPYLRCWSPVSHGSINVVQALAVSCNCFFCETTYRLGNAKEGNPEDSISALNKYMVAFGLNERTGVEIGEAYDTRRADAITQTQISSPEYKEYLDRQYDRYAISNWFDGDTVATSIGQSKNNYTAASMAKYVSILANGGKRYKLHFVDRREDYFGNLVEKVKPVQEGEALELAPDTWNAVYQGMYNAVNVSGGTGYNTFQDFPFVIGGKTGTAEEIKNRLDHTSFAGFVPFENPKYAIYVNIPFGNTTGTPTAAGYVAREVILELMGGSYAPQLPEKVNSLTQ